MVEADTDTGQAADKTADAKSKKEDLALSREERAKRVSVVVTPEREEEDDLALSREERAKRVSVVVTPEREREEEDDLALSREERAKRVSVVVNQREREEEDLALSREERAKRMSEGYTRERGVGVGVCVGGGVFFIYEGNRYACRGTILDLIIHVHILS